MNVRLVNTFVICASRVHCHFYKTMMASLLVPPASVRGMTCLDRDAFTKTLQVPCIRLQNINLSKIMPTLKKYILKIKNFKPVVSSEKDTIVYLDPKKVETLDDIPESDREIIKSFNAELRDIELNLTYDNWKLDDVLKAILPEKVEVPTAYSQIGHIVHLNLRESQLPYKALIGQVFLDKVSNAKTVVNKINVIDTTFRFFSMEILSGEDNTVVEVKENGFRYQFDFAKVYWNPRLGTEHEKIVNFLKANDVLYDVFAGVGPFAVPAARKGVKVLANDLNPESYKWLLKNAKLNKTKDNLSAFNKDGRDFLRNEVKTDILKRRENDKPGVEHIVMNLPAMAVEFLDVFENLFTEEEISKVSTKQPQVHVYCFVKPAKNEEPFDVAKLLVEGKLDAVLCPKTLVEIHHVRNVSPNKEMMRVSFFLTEKILRGGEPAKKKAKANYDNDVFTC